MVNDFSSCVFCRFLLELQLNRRDKLNEIVAFMVFQAANTEYTHTHIQLTHVHLDISFVESKQSRNVCALAFGP